MYILLKTTFCACAIHGVQLPRMLNLAWPKQPFSEAKMVEQYLNLRKSEDTLNKICYLLTDNCPMMPAKDWK